MPQGGAALLLRAAQGGQPCCPKSSPPRVCCVTDVPLYDTVYRCDKADELVRGCWTPGAIDVVTFTSASTVEGFAQAAAGADCTGFTALCIGTADCKGRTAPVCDERENRNNATHRRLWSPVYLEEIKMCQ